MEHWSDLWRGGWKQGDVSGELGGRPVNLCGRTARERTMDGISNVIVCGVLTGDDCMSR